MRKEQKDIDPSLGPVGIFQEAFKIFRTHAKVFVLIQLTLMLGLAIVQVGVDYFVFKSLPYPSPPPTGTANSRHYNLSKSFGVSFNDSPVIDAIISWLFAIGYGLVMQAAVSLSLSVTLYSVGLHYAGQAVSFLDVIRASVPYLWMRLAVTTTYYYLIVNSVSLVQTVGILLLPQNPIWMMVWATVWAGLLLVGGFALGIIFTVASGVSVLEEDYGWAAMAKGLKLLKGKLVVAVTFRILLLVPGSILMGLLFAFYYEVSHEEYSALLVPTAVLQFISMTFLWQFTALCSGVQYASFKAYHNESFTDSLHQKRAKGGYDRIVDGTNEALLGGQEVGNNV